MAKRGRTQITGQRKKARYGKKTYKSRMTKFKRGYRSGKNKPKGFKKWQSKARWTGVDFPQVLQKKFSWVQTMDIAPYNSSGVNFSQYQTVRIGSLYDPDYAVGGNSVNYFSNFLNAGLYQKYQVMGAKIIVDLVNPTTQMVSVYNFLISLSERSTYQANLLQQQLDDLARGPRSRDICYIGPAEGGKNQKKISFYVKPWTIGGITRAQYMADQTYWGSYNNSPANGLFFVMHAICTLPNQGALLRSNVSVVYYTRMFQNINATSMTTGDGNADYPPDEGLVAKSDGTDLTPEEMEKLQEE